jgi:hypothetical protein
MNNRYDNNDAKLRDCPDPKRRRIHGDGTPYRGRSSSSAQSLNRYKGGAPPNDRHILHLQETQIPRRLPSHGQRGRNQMQQQPRRQFSSRPPVYGQYRPQQSGRNPMQQQRPPVYGQYRPQQSGRNQIQMQQQPRHHFDLRPPYRYESRHYGGRNSNYSYGAHGHLSRRSPPDYSNNDNAIRTTQNIRIDFAGAQSKDDSFRMLNENKHAWNPSLVAAAWLFFRKSLTDEMDLRFIMQWDHQLGELLGATKGMVNSFKSIQFKNVFRSLAEISAILKEERAANALGLNGTTICKLLLDEAEIFSSFANTAAQMMPQFDRRDICSIVQAYGKSGRPQLHDGRDLLAVLGDHVVNRKLAFLFDSPAEGRLFAFNLAHTYAIYGFKHPKMFDCIADFIVSHDDLHHFEQGHIPKIFWAYTKNCHRHPGLKYKIIKHISGLF